MNACRTCKHWLSDLKDEDITPHNKTMGRCLAVLEHHSYGHYDDPEKAAKANMVVMDGSDYFAALFTTPEHGCTEWQSAEGD